MTESTPNYTPTWDLDTIFPGGSDSPELGTYVDKIVEDLGSLEVKAGRTETPRAPDQARQWIDLLLRMQDIDRRASQVSSFIECLTAQNTRDRQARIWEGRITQLEAALEAAAVRIDSQLAEMPEDAWQAILQDSRLRDVTFSLEERRRRAAARMVPELEVLAGDLAVDGYHGWGQLYDTVVGRISVPVEEDGRTVALSVGQASNRMDDPDRRVRQRVFASWEEAWRDASESCAEALNHLAGFRLNLYRHRGWESVLREPLDINRMSAETLQAMWDAVDEGKARVVQYLNGKARLLGVDRLAWYDVGAPVTADDATIPYNDAAAFVIDQFRRFNPAMADFAQQAFERRWIEAEDRAGKRPGGFCTNFPQSRESRIFMTFSGTASNLGTLAHELGHAYHQHLVDDLPPMSQHYAMNVAETASTFAEQVVADAAIRHAPSEAQRLTLLEDKLQRGVSFFMNIHARFLFETRFYDARMKGPLDADALNELMLAAQREAYCGALSVYNPTFWASKLHFYITGVPFYNFPYTFGYLFSMGVYARAQEEGASFARRYDDLLRDTGRMTVEDLAARHLGVDLAKPAFWRSTVQHAVADVDEFLRLTSSPSE